MNTQRISLPVSPAIGAVTAEYIVPDNAFVIMTLAHGAGAGMDHFFMTELAARLAGVGIATLRFNFPFTEGKKGRPDTPAVAHATIAAALSRAHADFPSLPLFAAGKSFGGRMTSQYLAGQQPGQPRDEVGAADDPREGVRGIVFYGFPLHPPGKPSVERADHLKKLAVPKLFLQGTKDELAPWDLIYSVCSSLRKTRLVKIEGANHAFKAGRKDVIGMLVGATRDWIEKTR